ncbi:MAG: hypothetical protein RIR18_2068, partial [Pseudomonadota bacterium]
MALLPSIGSYPSKAVSPAARAAELIAQSDSIKPRGAIFTRQEVVNFILDLAGYTEDQQLHKFRLLEPSFGEGDFLVAIVQRLLVSWRATTGGNGCPIGDLGNAIRATELHRNTFLTTRDRIAALLEKECFKRPAIEELLSCWLIQGDFLLLPIEGYFDFVVGNPPYIRQELIPPALIAEYRSRYQTIYDRADIYIPFIERSLSLLSKQGSLGFICADRWMKNRYGGPLRRLIAEQFHLKVYVDMVDTQAFQSEVNAYPAITVITRGKPGVTRIAHRPAINHATLTMLAATLRSKVLPKDSDSVRELANVTSGHEPWLLESSDQMALIRRLEAEFPILEDTGCKVGIGVATGADKAFIGHLESLDVEPDRKVPLVTTKDIVSGKVIWLGQGVINPFKDEGGLVDLDQYPRLQRYLEERRDMIAGRHCAKKAEAGWYRTIDRITPSLAAKQKLLIPDIKGKAHIVFEDGHLYPHHNLYFITSAEWDLRALQAILLSEISRLFIATYSTKMRGGFLRFQAQYL